MSIIRHIVNFQQRILLKNQSENTSMIFNYINILDDNIDDEFENKNTMIKYKTILINFVTYCNDIGTTI